ncbi:MAG: hypothetical protein ABII90_14355 [Bacteroidota bacterium]
MRNIISITLICNYVIGSLVFAQTSEPKLSVKMPAGQANNSEINELEKEINFKIIKFSVYGINSMEDAAHLKKIIESKDGIQSCETDINKEICTIIARFSIQKKDIVDITGPAGIKTSNYTEEIYIKHNPPTKNTMTEEQKAQLLYKRQQNTYGNRNNDVKTYEMNQVKEIKKQAIIENSGDLPADFPRYVDTGNPEDDQKKYAKAKEQWIHDNPWRYNELFNKNKSKIKIIHYKEFINMPAEKQNEIKNNPDKFKIVK